MHSSPALNSPRVNNNKNNSKETENMNVCPCSVYPTSRPNPMRSRTDTAGVTSASNLPYSDGTTSPVGFIVDSFSWTDGWTATPTMLKGGGYYGTGSPRDPNASRVLTITGLADGTGYDLVIAGLWQPQENGFVATVGSTVLTNQGNVGTGWVEGGNYVHFTSLHPVGGQITVTLNPDVDNGVPPAVSQYIILGGFQLEALAVPEPGTIMLFGVGGLLLWRLKKTRE